MAALTLQRCLRHLEREAVARCPQCEGFFCRECITEHDDQIICADCLSKITSDESRRTSTWRHPMRALAMLSGLLLTITFFHSIGKALVLTPSSFHEGTIWKQALLEDAE